MGMCQMKTWAILAAIGAGALLGGQGVGPLAVAPAHAYSYAAAGKEPLIDAREAALKAIGEKDWTAAAAALQTAKDELVYLEGHHHPGLQKELSAALDAKDEAALRSVLRVAFAAEIDRRLDGAQQNLKDYQASKVLVVKGRRFLDAVGADMDPTKRKAAEDGLNKALAAIGNPGVFGVGAKPVDADAFAKAYAEVKAALGL